MRVLGRVAVLAACLLLAAPATPAGANHPQTDSGHVIVFDHKGGNEWWVEVLVSGQDAGSVVKMEAMDDGGPWVTMTYHPEWGFGDYAASFHIEPGHRVLFRASWSGGAQQLSCWFTHPAGAEQCGTSPPPPPPPEAGATFAHPQGNEWWVQVQVNPVGGAVTRAQVRANGGAWQPLQLQSWGTRMYAASYHLPQGTVVQFQATLDSGAQSVSACYQWIPPKAVDAAQVACTGSPPPPPAPSAVYYSSLKGNEWWIEAKASSKSPIAGVDTRVNGGTWVPMQLKSWGSWAVSTHAPQGSHVQFRARFPDGTYAWIPNGYVWTAATQWPPPSSTFDARFENVKGNPGWVQVNVYASASWGLQGVSYRIDGGAWQPMTRQTYGDWTAATPVPDGSYVQFRAESGQTLMSGQYVWPSARAVSAWPVEGSFATYHLSEGRGSPGCCWSQITSADLRLEYHGGRWSGTCIGHTDETSADGSTTTHTDWTFAAHEAPPAGPNPAVMDASTNLHPLMVSGYGPSCGHTEMVSTTYAKERVATSLSDPGGDGITLMAWRSHHDPADTTPESSDADWETHLGLMLQWSHSAIDSGGYSGYLSDTDAPIR